MLPLLPYIPYCARTHAGVSARFSPFQVQGRPSSIGSGDDAPVGRFDAIEAVGCGWGCVAVCASGCVVVCASGCAAGCVAGRIGFCAGFLGRSSSGGSGNLFCRFSPENLIPWVSFCNLWIVKTPYLSVSSLIVQSVEMINKILRLSASSTNLSKADGVCSRPVRPSPTWEINRTRPYFRTSTSVETSL